MSAAGYAALRANEGVVMRYYNDAPVNGNCTWGVGTLEHFGPCTAEELRRAVLPAQVNAMLQLRVREAERIVRSVVTDHPLLSRHQDIESYVRHLKPIASSRTGWMMPT
jgi:lysozyme